MNHDTEPIATTLVADGKGILADDETPGTLTKRFDALGIRSTAESRGAYREMLFTAPDVATSISGVIMQDETIGQKTSTLRCLRRTVPAAVPGIVFLSGGQRERSATAHLDAINRLPAPKPWTVGFSYGRALQDSALETWRGRDANLEPAQAALSHRARCNRAASLGRYTDDVEGGA